MYRYIIFIIIFTFISGCISASSNVDKINSVTKVTKSVCIEKSKQWLKRAESDYSGGRVDGGAAAAAISAAWSNLYSIGGCS